jgi:methylisocitrate lyase
MTTHPGRRLRQLMQRDIVVAPGAYSGLVARAVAREGFPAVYVSGGAITANSGVPDIGLRGAEHFTRIIRELADSSGLPVLSDADTGFGEAEMVAKTLRDFQSAGAAGFHIEDQTFPKRCGHLGGKTLIPIEHFQEKIDLAARARDESGGHFVVCARTDARSVDGLDAAIERAKAYVDAGADMIFPEGLQSEDEFKRVAAALAGYGSRSLAPGGGPFILANMTEFGKTPDIAHDRFRELGVHLVIHPVSTLRIAMKAVERFLASLKENGRAEPALASMQTRSELYDLLRYTPGEPWVYPSSETDQTSLDESRDEQAAATKPATHAT